MTAEEIHANCIRHRSSLLLSYEENCLRGQRYTLDRLILYV